MFVKIIIYLRSCFINIIVFLLFYRVISSKTKQKIQKSKINELSKPKEINQEEMCRTVSKFFIL